MMMTDDVSDKYRKRPSNLLSPRPRMYLSSRSAAATNAYAPATTAFAGASNFSRIDVIEDTATDFKLSNSLVGIH